MKDNIYTIPLTDAMHHKGECPFCFIMKKLEEDAISFTLGASYMEDDIRAETDKKGFCPTHYKKLYDYGNRLGLALILHTHYQSLLKSLELLCEKGELPQASFLERLIHKKSKPSCDNKNTFSLGLSELTKDCYVCDRIEKDKQRYLNTFFYLYSNQPEFKLLVANSKGFCLPHLSDLINHAPYLLSEDVKQEFFNITKNLLLESLIRLEKDLSWFIDKNDYRNVDAPWGEAETAIPRSIQKLTGIYVNHPIFKQQK